MRALVTGATGFVGGRLTRALLERGHEVRALVRDRDRAKEIERAGAELHQGDVLEADSLAGIGEGVDAAYYLVHGMGRGADGDFAARERRAAANFAGAVTAGNAERLIYLGGLGDQPSSEHLRSRHETARILGEQGPPLTYLRAAMVVGSQSASYITLRHLVQRLPVMISPAWLSTDTQPIGIDDVLEYLIQAPTVERAAGREVQIGGPDVISYREMLDRMSQALGRRPRPKLPVPVISPWLSAKWIGLVTPVDAGVARPLVEGLATETIVTDRSGSELFDIEPVGIDEALRRALAEDNA